MGPGLSASFESIIASLQSSAATEDSSRSDFRTIRRAGFGEGGLCGLTGQYAPFRATRADRLAAGDPRLSVEERYPEGVAKLLAAAAERLVAEGYLLPEDATRLIAAAR